MTASITDKARKGASSFSTTLAADKSAGAASASISSATGVPTDTAIDFTVGRVDANGNKTPALKAVYKATLSGTTISNLTLVEGTDQLHKAGTPVEITLTAASWNDLINLILTQHKQDGTHGAVTATSLTVTGATVLANGSIGSDEISLDFAETTLGSAFTSAATNTWQDSGLNVSLPTKGTWVVVSDLRVELPTTIGAFAAVRFFNTTGSAVITNSERLTALNPAASAMQNTIPLTMRVVTTASPTVIRVDLQPGGAYVCKLNADTNGKSHMMAFRIGA